MTIYFNGGDDSTNNKVFLKTKDCKCDLNQVPEDNQDANITFCPCLKVVVRPEPLDE